LAENVTSGGCASRCAERLRLSALGNEDYPRSGEAEPPRCEKIEKEKADRKAGGFPHIRRQSRKPVELSHESIHQLVRTKKRGGTHWGRMLAEAI